MRVVVDTNVLVSALMSPSGLPAILLLLAIQRQFQIYVSAEVLAEYEDVLRRPELKLRLGEVDTAMQQIKAIAQPVAPARRLRISTDETDNRFYECAEAAAADYLVTGNRRHFKHDLPPTKIIDVRQFLRVLQE
jgi:uncharacterized protein